MILYSTLRVFQYYVIMAENDDFLDYVILKHPHCRRRKTKICNVIIYTNLVCYTFTKYNRKICHFFQTISISDDCWHGNHIMNVQF